MFQQSRLVLKSFELELLVTSMIVHEMRNVSAYTAEYLEATLDYRDFLFGQRIL